MLCVHDVLGATSLKAAEEIINKEDLDVILIEYEMVEKNSDSWNDVLMLPAKKKGIPVIRETGDGSLSPYTSLY